jgi:hypothetical protein
VCPDAKTALFDAELDDARRLPASSDAAASALYPQISKMLGGPTTLLYATSRATVELTLLLASPPIIVIGPRLASLRAQSRSEIDVPDDTGLRFRLGRMVELARTRRIFAAANRAAFARLVAGLLHGSAVKCRRSRGHGGSRAIAPKLSVALRKRDLSARRDSSRFDRSRRVLHRMPARSRSRRHARLR